jgi:hypothetical protein
MASVQVSPAVQHPGSAIPAGMTQQQAQEIYLVRPTPSPKFPFDVTSAPLAFFLTPQ